MSKVITGVTYVNLASINKDIQSNKVLPICLSFMVRDTDIDLETGVAFYEIYCYKAEYLDNLTLKFVNFRDTLKSVFNIDSDIYIPVYYKDNKPLYTFLENSNSMYEVPLNNSWIDYIKLSLISVHSLQYVTQTEYNDVIDYTDFYNLKEVSTGSIEVESFIQKPKNEAQNKVITDRTDKSINDEIVQMLDNADNTTTIEVNNPTESIISGQNDNKMDSATSDEIDKEIDRIFNSDSAGKIDIDFSKSDKDDFSFFDAGIINVAGEEDKPKFKGLGELPDNVEFSSDKVESRGITKRLLNNGVVPVTVGW